MARYNDNSFDYTHWTNGKLIARLRETANLQTFSPSTISEPPTLLRTGESIRDVTRIYRETWVEPIIAEIERRFVKGAK